MRWAIAVVCSFFVGSCAPPPGPASKVPSVQIAHLNHFYATVDAEIVAAIRDSAFVKRFANLEVRTTTCVETG
jgi:hypothetical protein